MVRKYGLNTLPLHTVKLKNRLNNGKSYLAVIGSVVQQLY